MSFEKDLKDALQEDEEKSGVAKNTDRDIYKTLDYVAKKTAVVKEIVRLDARLNQTEKTKIIEHARELTDTIKALHKTPDASISSAITKLFVEWGLEVEEISKRIPKVTIHVEEEEKESSEKDALNPPSSFSEAIKYEFTDKNLSLTKEAKEAGRLLDNLKTKDNQDEIAGLYSRAADRIVKNTVKMEALPLAAMAIGELAYKKKLISQENSKADEKFFSRLERVDKGSNSNSVFRWMNTENFVNSYSVYGWMNTENFVNSYMSKVNEKERKALITAQTSNLEAAEKLIASNDATAFVQKEFGSLHGEGQKQAISGLAAGLQEEYKKGNFEPSNDLKQKLAREALYNKSKGKKSAPETARAHGALKKIVHIDIVATGITNEDFKDSFLAGDLKAYATAANQSKRQEVIIKANAAYTRVPAKSNPAPTKTPANSPPPVPSEAQRKANEAKLVLENYAKLKSIILNDKENKEQEIESLFRKIDANLIKKVVQHQDQTESALEKNKGKTVLMFAIRTESEKEDPASKEPLISPVIQLLLDNGAGLIARDEKGQTPLILAAKYGREKLVEKLLERKPGKDGAFVNQDVIAHINVQNTSGTIIGTALDHATWQNGDVFRKIAEQIRGAGGQNGKKASINIPKPSEEELKIEQAKKSETVNKAYDLLTKTIDPKDYSSEQQKNASEIKEVTSEIGDLKKLIQEHLDGIADVKAKERSARKDSIALHLKADYEKSTRYKISQMTPPEREEYLSEAPKLLKDKEKELRTLQPWIIDKDRLAAVSIQHPKADELQLACAYIEPTLNISKLPNSFSQALKIFETQHEEKQIQAAKLLSHLENRDNLPADKAQELIGKANSENQSDAAVFIKEQLTALQEAAAANDKSNDNQVSKIIALTGANINPSHGEKINKIFEAFKDKTTKNLSIASAIVDGTHELAAGEDSTVAFSKIFTNLALVEKDKADFIKNYVNFPGKREELVDKLMPAPVQSVVQSNSGKKSVAVNNNSTSTSASDDARSAADVKKAMFRDYLTHDLFDKGVFKDDSYFSKLKKSGAQAFTLGDNGQAKRNKYILTDEQKAIIDAIVDAPSLEGVYESTNTTKQHLKAMAEKTKDAVKLQIDKDFIKGALTKAGLSSQGQAWDDQDKDKIDKKQTALLIEQGTKAAEDYALGNNLVADDKLTEEQRKRSEELRKSRGEQEPNRSQAAGANNISMQANEARKDARTFFRLMAWGAFIGFIVGGLVAGPAGAVAGLMIGMTVSALVGSSIIGKKHWSGTQPNNTTTPVVDKSKPEAEVGQGKGKGKEAEKPTITAPLTTPPDKSPTAARVAAQATKSSSHAL